MSASARVRRAGALFAALACATACVGTTGGQVVTFPVAAAGPSDVASPLAFDSDRGWHVVLTQAKLHVGALYLSQALPVSGAQSTACILPAAYVAEATRGGDVDLLSPLLQPFPIAGEGTTTTARAAQVWLTGGDVSDPDDTTPILILEGTATLGADARPFTATLTIGANRQTGTSGDVAGANPICKQRIVTPIPTNVRVEDVGLLLLRVDPRLLFVNVDFASLAADPAKAGSFLFSDDPTSPDYGQASANLYANLHAAGHLYDVSWISTR